MNVIYFCKRIVISKNSIEAKVVGAYWSCLFSQPSGRGLQFRAIKPLILFAYISEPSGDAIPRYRTVDIVCLYIQAIWVNTFYPDR